MVSLCESWTINSCSTISQRHHWHHYPLLGADTMSAPRDCTTGCRVNRVRRIVCKGGFGGKPGPRPAETGGTHGSGVAGRRSPDARGFQGGVRANAPLDAVGNRVLWNSKVSPLSTVERRRPAKRAGVRSIPTAPPSAASYTIAISSMSNTSMPCGAPRTP